MTTHEAASAAAGISVFSPKSPSFGLRYGALFGPVVFGVTAAGVALPDVASSLNTSPTATAWVLTAHALALGVGTALFGRLADTRGVRAALLLGSLVLAAGAVVCLVAPGLGVLVAGRFVEAAGSGAMAACAMALAAGVPPDRRARAFAGFGATMAAFSAGATLAGGILTEWVTWRVALVLPALSLLVVPLCLAGASTRVPGRNDSGRSRAMDLPGAALLTLTAMSFLVLIQSSALALTTPLVTATAAVLLLSAAGLTWRIRGSETSFVPRALVTDRVFLKVAVIGVGVYGGLFAALYAVPQLLVRDHGWSVLSVGLWLLPGAVAGAVLSRLAGRLTAGDHGNRLLGAVSLAFAVALAGALTGSGVLLILGASLGFSAFSVTQVFTTALMSGHIEPGRRGGAMGLLNLTFFVGGGVGSATAGALANSMPLSTALGVVALFPLITALTAFTPARRFSQGLGA
ncbi:MFS transporter [Streptomyces sp. ADI98-10]|uniref:MFS transporter n=1 Tax=Streptomyces sp. ADI98-10 TaxID=1522763 RepID=UPI000F558DFE|nr:MFS transporter [Streptomyces sp. ADI98-10]RPK82051.1 putative multidrug resistance protein EmrY [Streptomyces sp. ADI98-10]